MIKDYSVNTDHIKLEEDKKEDIVIYHTLKGTLEEWKHKLKTKKLGETKLKDFKLQGRCYKDRYPRYVYRNTEEKSNYSHLHSYMYYKEENQEFLKENNIGYRDLMIITFLIFKALFIYVYNNKYFKLPYNLGIIFCNKSNKIDVRDENIAFTHFDMNYVNAHTDEIYVHTKGYDIYPRYAGYIIAIKAMVKNFFKNYEN